MKAHRSFVSSSVAALALGLACGLPAHAELLVHEPFNYTSGTPSGPTNNGWLLAGQSGGGETGFAAGSTWSTFTNSSSPITAYAEGSVSGVNYNTTGPVAHTFAGTVANLPTSGGYFGMGGTNNTDHMQVWRTLDPSVVAKFTPGSTTWFSFVSCRGYAANPAGFKLALGKGRLLEDRGSSATGESIGGGSGLGSSERNTRKVYPQFWDSVPGSAGETTGTFDNYDVQGKETGSSTNVHYISAPYLANGLTIPTNDSDGLQSMLAPTPPSPHAVSPVPYIVIGKIEWQANGTPDVVSVVMFRQTDTLSKAAFDAAIAAQPLLCSANWPLGIPQPDLDQSLFDTLSLAGGKWFGDEIRIATTFEESVGSTPIAETQVTLTIARNAGNLDFTWNSESGKRYNLRTSTDLSTSPSTWTLVQGDIVPTPPTNTLSIAQPADPARYYVIETYPAPFAPLSPFPETFDGTVADWTSGYDDLDISHLTTWELGTPTNAGPLAAYSGTKCYATNIATWYGTGANIWLRSPEIDLTTYSAASLRFKEWKDIESSVGDGDFGAIRILKSSDNSVLAVLEADVEGHSAAWETYSKDLPGGALAQPIKIEFRFKSDDWDEPLATPPPPYAGWYIDDFEILVPGA